MFLQACFFQVIVNPLPAFPLCDTGHCPQIFQALPDRQIGIQGKFLRKISYFLLNGRIIPLLVYQIIHPHFPGIRPKQCGKHPHQCGLAGTIFPKKPINSGWNRKRNIVQGLYPFLKRNRYIFYLN